MLVITVRKFCRSEAATIQLCIRRPGMWQLSTWTGPIADSFPRYISSVTTCVFCVRDACMVVNIRLSCDYQNSSFKYDTFPGFFRQYQGLSEATVTTGLSRARHCAAANGSRARAGLQEGRYVKIMRMQLLQVFTSILAFGYVCLSVCLCPFPCVRVFFFFFLGGGGALTSIDGFGERPPPVYSLFGAVYLSMQPRSYRRLT